MTIWVWLALGFIFWVIFFRKLLQKMEELTAWDILWSLTSLVLMVLSGIFSAALPLALYADEIVESFTRAGSELRNKLTNIILWRRK